MNMPLKYKEKLLSNINREGTINNQIAHKFNELKSCLNHVFMLKLNSTF